MKYKIKILSAIPGGIDHGKFLDYTREVTADSVEEALGKYHQQMKDILPKRQRYELEATDNNQHSVTAILENK